MFLSQDFLDPSKFKSPVKKALHDPTAERRKSHVFNETLLDKELSHWSECKINGKKIQRRSYHSSVCYDKKLYIYGGYEVNQGILQDFIVIDLDEKLPSFQWEEAEVRSKIHPGPLCRHSTVIYKDKMYIYGGQVSSLRNTSQFMAYSFTTKEWSRVVPSNVEGLPPIDSHVAALWEKDSENTSMIVVGGFIGGRIGQYSNAVFEYSFNDNQWTVLSKNKYIEAGSPQSSVFPQGRMSLGATIYKNNLYIFGGNEGNTKFNDLWKFDLLAKKWTQVKVEGSNIPEARSGITLTNYKHMLILFGGILDITHEKNDIFVFNINTGKWNVAEQSTKWVFTQEDHNKLPKVQTVKKSNFSKGDLSARVVSLPTSPRNQSLSKTKFKNIKQIDSDYASQITDQSQDFSVTDRPVDCKKKVRFEKLELPTIFNNGSPRTKISKSGGLIGGQTLFKSSIEENHIKNRMLKKMILLNEFEVSEKEAAILRAVTPATEALIKSLQSLSTTPLATERMETTAAHLETSLRPGKKEEKIKAGVKPVARDGHSATIVDNKMYIFAGDRHRVAFNDLFTLDLGYFANL